MELYTQKALTTMKIRLKEVLSQIHGKSGMAIIEAILKGERDKYALVNLCHQSVLKNKKELVLKSLEGRYTQAGLFALKQAHAGCLFYWYIQTSRSTPLLTGLDAQAKVRI